MASIGFTWLRDHFNLDVAPLTHSSYTGSRRRVESVPMSSSVVEWFPQTYYPANDAPLEHIEFGLKYDDLSLDLLRKAFLKIPPADVAAYIDERPSSKYCRQIGFLFEFLTAVTLPLKKTVSGNYADVLDSDRYVTASPVKNQRWLINNNLLGAPAFCPIVRKTANVCLALASDATSRLENFQGEIPPDLFKRAIDYLYFKETKSSYDIERETATPDREEKFVEALKHAGLGSDDETLAEPYLAGLQGMIVDPRFAQDGFRDWQNYVGQDMVGRAQRIHYVCPPGQLVQSLMAGLTETAAKSRGVNAIVRAALISFGFVFIHPFEDGNGRLHRFLVHDILARDKFVPAGMILPVSAYMLRHQREYDSILEKFSKPLSRMARYTMNADAEMTVTNPDEIESYYRFPDLTDQVEYLSHAIEHTITSELIAEVIFLKHYDEVRALIKDIVDMPDRLVDLMIKLLHQNNGVLSKTKRSRFVKLTDAEIAHMERAYQDTIGQPSGSLTAAEPRDASDTNLTGAQKASNLLGVRVASAEAPDLGVTAGELPDAPSPE